MQLNNLKNHQKKSKKRVGRGNGSGHGTYSGKGLKGQKSRSGFSLIPGFEGGQLRLIKKLAKLKGFKNHNKVINQHITLEQLNLIPSNLEINDIIRIPPVNSQSKSASISNNLFIDINRTLTFIKI